MEEKPNRYWTWGARKNMHVLPAAILLVASSGASADASAQTPAGARVVIRQIYGGGGTAYAQDYVELFNRSDSVVSLAGWSIQYASATGSGTFASNGQSPLAGALEPGRSLLVAIGAAGASGAPLPAPFVAGHPTLNLASTSGKLALVRSTVGLPCHGGPSAPCDVSALASIEDLVGYGTANFFEGASAAPAASATLAVARVASGCRDTDENAVDFATTAPSPRTQTSPPIVCADLAACGAPATPIHAIQGAGASSPRLGETLSVEAIVTARFQGSATNSLQGFFVQASQAEADLDPATSEGIFVSEVGSGAAAVAVGSRVRIVGTVAESAGTTILRSLGGVEICRPDLPLLPLPEPALLTLPIPGVPTNDLAAARAALADYAERFEGMRVRFAELLSVADLASLGRAGQLVLQQGEGLRAYTDADAPDVAGYLAHRIGTARGRVVLDDVDDRLASAWANGRPLPYPTPGLSLSNRLRAGDTISDLAGILDGTIGSTNELPVLRLRPTLETRSHVLVHANPRPAAPPAVGGTLRLASFNVLNYFATLDTTASGAGPCGPSGTLDCRGADSAAELDRQTAKLAAALCGLDADVVALMELENDADEASASRLVAALDLVAGCGPYAVVPTGSIGSDAIKVGLLFKTTTIERVGAWAVLDESVDPRFDEDRNRPVLAQTFRDLATSDRFTVAAAHLKSKGSSCSAQGDPDLGDGQGHCNRTRTRAAQALADWLANDPTVSLDPDFAVLGDLNAYPREDPIAAILASADDLGGTADDWVDLIAARALPNGQGVPSASSTHRFDGASGRLDHALASSTLALRVTGAAAWSINADEPPAFDFDDSILDPGESLAEAKPGALPLYAPDAFRSSDHDPIIVGLIALPEPSEPLLLGLGGWVVLARSFSARPAPGRTRRAPRERSARPIPGRNDPPRGFRGPVGNPGSSCADPP